MDEGTEAHRHPCADGGRVGIRPGPDRAEPCLDAAMVASVQLLGSGVASSRGSMPGKGVDASVSLACCWLCLASIAAGHRQRRDAVGPGHTGRPMGTRQERNSRQKQHREVNRRTSGQENSLPACKPQDLPWSRQASDPVFGVVGAMVVVGGLQWWAARNHPRRGCQRCHWLNCRPATCRRWQDFGRRGSVVSTHNVTPSSWCLLVAMNPSNVQAGRSVEGLNAKECTDGWARLTVEGVEAAVRPEQRGSWEIGPRSSVMLKKMESITQGAVDGIDGTFFQVPAVPACPQLPLSSSPSNCLWAHHISTFLPRTRMLTLVILCQQLDSSDELYTDSPFLPSPSPAHLFPAPCFTGPLMVAMFVRKVPACMRRFQTKQAARQAVDLFLSSYYEVPGHWRIERPPQRVQQAPSMSQKNSAVRHSTPCEP